MSGPDEIDRLRWRCRRGMLELDVLLWSFVEDGYGELDASERRALSLLLERDDLELYEWLSGRGVPPAAMRTVVDKLRSCKVRRP